MTSRYAAGAPRCLVATACILLGAALGGCGIGRDPGVPASLQAPIPGQDPGSGSVADGTAVSPDAARILASAPVGAEFRYPRVDHSPGMFVLGPVYQSGLGVPCRVGRVKSEEAGSASPTAYAFCRRGNQWYEMDPVVVSGL